MSAAFWKVFELAISVWENILLLEFCMDFMQQKPRGKKGKVLWGIAVLFGLIFPALEKYPALYDRWEMWITLIWLFVYLMVGTQGSVLRKVTAAVVARAVLMMVNTAILFGGSFILQESVASFIQDQDTVRIAIMLLSKISYFFVGKLLNSLLFERENLISWQWIVMDATLFSQLLRRYYDFGSKRSAKCADAGTEMDFAVRMLYLADVPDYVLYSTAKEQG